ncbi:MAG: hypothetical protein AAFX50_03285 [Acidobacteriota bacterium]
MSKASPSLEEAVELLVLAARRDIEAHPRGHLIRSRRLEVTVELPLRGDVASAAESVRADLSRAVDEAARVGAAQRPGHVIDLRTGEPAPPPADGRMAFVGYEANGAPRFVPFPQWLLDLGHPEQEQLYSKPPGLVTVPLDLEDIHGEVLPAFRPEQPPARSVGQLVAGWFKIPHRDGSPGYVALTFQVLETGVKKKRYLLDVLGSGPHGEPLEEAVARLDEPPWRAATQWTQKALDSIRYRSGGRTLTDKALDARIQGILGGLGRRLHQVRRGRQRRTGHAEERHKAGSRPTRMAVADLERARDEHVLWDRRRETVVILGDRGRAHVWSPQGKLVTSIRYTPESIERKKRANIWRPATKDEAETLRLAVQHRARS